MKKIDEVKNDNPKIKLIYKGPYFDHQMTDQERKAFEIIKREIEKFKEKPQ